MGELEEEQNEGQMNRRIEGHGQEDRDTSHFLHLFPSCSGYTRKSQGNMTNTCSRSLQQAVLCINNTRKNLLLPVPQTQVTCKQIIKPKKKS